MNVVVLNMPQRSPEWHAVRCAKLTGSQAKHLFSEGRKKGEPSVGLRDLTMAVALERVTGQSQDEDSFVSRVMQHGIDKEDTAVRAYEAKTGQLVKRVGFVESETLPVGCSPDGVIGALEGILEVKCPKQWTHWQNRSGGVPAEYLPQITHNLWVTGAEWCDFVSFDDRFPPALRLFPTRVFRADVDIPGYVVRVEKFLADVEQEFQAIATLADLGAVLKQAAGVAA